MFIELMSHINASVVGIILSIVSVPVYSQHTPGRIIGWEDIGYKDYRVYVPKYSSSLSQVSEYTGNVSARMRLNTSVNETQEFGSTGMTFKVHTNLAYDVALAPAAGLELSFSDNWTVGTDAWIAWLRNSRHNAWYEHYGFDMYGRYWFGKEHTKPFVGYHVGPYAGTFTYDLYPEGKGYQCNKMFKTFRVGAEFGYAVPVKNFTFDFYAGIGYLHTRQDVYYPNKFSNGYYKAYRRYRNLPDFTRFGVTAGYVFGK